jgi:hypothetical protein
MDIFILKIACELPIDEQTGSEQDGDVNVRFI